MSTNKIALITGGSRGLGKNTALKLAKNGNDVIITYRSKKEEAEEVVKEIEAQGLKATCFMGMFCCNISFARVIILSSKYQQGGLPVVSFMVLVK